MCVRWKEAALPNRSRGPQDGMLPLANAVGFLDEADESGHALET